MKVVSFSTDEEVNKFLGDENIKVESITPVPNESNGIIWAITYKERKDAMSVYWIAAAVLTISVTWL